MPEVSCRKALKNIKSYAPAKTLEAIQEELGISNILRLAANENTMGSSPMVEIAIQKTISNLYLYPDGMCTELRKKLADTYNLNSEQLIFSNGSFELISLIAQAYISEQDESIIPVPTFGWYKVVTLAMGGNVVEVPLKNHSINLEYVKNNINNKTKVIWLCNPNNPTGTIFDKTQLTNFLKSIPKNILVVLDEAYYEYATSGNYPETSDLLELYSNIIILRTFSKVYGLAALRVGYGITSKEIITELNKVRLPMNVNGIAQVAALASLEDQNFRKLCVENNNSGKEYYYNVFKEMNFEYIPTYTNFIMVNIKEDSIQVANEILKRGISVRAGVEFNMPTWLRITIGRAEENIRLVEVLKDVLLN